MFLIAHLSDLHIGESDKVETTLLEGISRINELKPDLVLVTGDLTENGYYNEFLRASEFIDMVKAPIKVVPGNHDSRNVGNETFEELFSGRWGTITNSKNTIKAICLDSSEPDLNYGKIGRQQQHWMENEIKDAKNNHQYIVVVLHHHIISVPKTGRERNVLADAGDILQSLTQNNVDLVISGHKHVPYVWKLENTIFATAGTISSFKLRGKDVNSFNTYHIDKNSLKICLNQLSGDKIILAEYK